MYKETGSYEWFKGLAQDSLVMNTDDLACAGVVRNLSFVKYHRPQRTSRRRQGNSSGNREAMMISSPGFLISVLISECAAEDCRCR